MIRLLPLADKNLSAHTSSQVEAPWSRRRCATSTQANGPSHLLALDIPPTP